MIICRGGIAFITKPMSRVLVMRDPSVTLFSGHVGNMHEQGIPCIAEAVFQWVFRLQTLYWNFTEGADGILSGDY